MLITLGIRQHQPVQWDTSRHHVVLIEGPAGCGKTILLNTIIRQSDRPVVFYTPNPGKHPDAPEHATRVPSLDTVTGPVLLAIDDATPDLRVPERILRDPTIILAVSGQRLPDIPNGLHIRFGLLTGCATIHDTDNQPQLFRTTFEK